MVGSRDSNRSEGQGGGREALSTKEVRSEGAVVGTQTGSEAVMRAMSTRESAKSNRHRKTHLVEPDDAGRTSSGTLPGEACRGRPWQESAEAIVAKIAAERRTERRAEEPRERRQPTNCGVAGVQFSETHWAWQLRPPPGAMTARRGGGIHPASPSWGTSLRPCEGRQR
jgi:hypothetical protein